jgi:aspartate racemase
MKKVGLVGGISWVSTIDYYRLVNEGVNKKLGGLQFAECSMYSLNFGAVQERGWPNAYPLLLHACESLKRGGATAIALCANTAHLEVERLEEAVGLPFINIITATAAAIHKKGLKKVALLGTQFTMEMDFYKAGLKKQGIEVLIPEGPDSRNFIQQTLKEELGAGIVKDTTKKAYLSIIDEMIARGAEGIVLGCTEIPMLVQQNDVQVPVFDTTQIHAQAIVNFMLSGN